MKIVKSKNGFTVYGREGGLIRPAVVIARPEQLPVETGTVTAGTAGTPDVKSKNLVGSGTNFQTALTVGDYIEFDLATPVVAMIKTITTDTAAVLGDPKNPGEDLLLYIPLGTSYRKYKSLWVGKTAPAGIEITAEESVAETKSSDGGEKAENVYSSAVKPMIKFELMEGSIETLNILLPGIVNFTRDVNGKIVASSFGPRNGYDFKKNAIRIAVIEYDGDSVSVNGEDRTDFFKVGFKGAFNLKKNSTDQTGIALEGYLFEDDTKMKNGKAQFWATNESSMVWDE